MPNSLKKSTPEGSFLQHMESSIVCLQSGFLIGPAGGADELDMVAYPVTGSPAAGFTLALAPDVAADITGWILESGYLTLAAGVQTARKFRILSSGPAAVVKSALPLTDTAGVAIPVASLVAVLEAAGIKVVDEPPQTSVQVTEEVAAVEAKKESKTSKLPKKS